MKPFDSKIKAKALKLYQSGLKINEVARELRIGATTAHTWIKAAGILRGPRRTEKEKKIACRMYLKGINAVNIAMELNIHPVTIGRWIDKEYGDMKMCPCCKRPWR